MSVAFNYSQVTGVCSCSLCHADRLHQAAAKKPWGLEKHSTEWWEDMYWKVARQFGELNRKLWETDQLRRQVRDTLHREAMLDIAWKEAEHELTELRKEYAERCEAEGQRRPLSTSKYL